MPTPLTPEAKIERLFHLRDYLVNLSDSDRASTHLWARELMASPELYEDAHGEVLTNEDRAEAYWEDPIGHESEHVVYSTITPDHPDWLLICYEYAAFGHR